MKNGFYLRLALDGMRKNRRLYLPYLLTCAGMVMMFYILSSLANSPLMQTMHGGDTMKMTLNLGTIVIAIFALLFLFYTNSFLARRRNKEFGLYNILGMNKRNLSRILLWETLISALFAIAGGLAGGLLFAKLAEMFLLHMAGEKVGYALRVEPGGILMAIAFFALIFALMLTVSLARMRLSKPLDMLKSESAGEKPPKANWLFALAGVILLGAAYYLALSIREPLTALALFFVAVLMVIAATYLLFIAGSVVLCRILQKNKGYYYRPEHFVSVSSMAFRMKRNGAGLASICILATMVLVMLSSTSCLYFGGEDALRGQCPYDMELDAAFDRPSDCTAESLDRLCRLAHDASGGQESGLVSFTTLEVSGYFDGGVLDINSIVRAVDMSSPVSLLEKLRSVEVFPLSDYNRLMGTELSLEPGEAMLWSSDGKYPWDSLTVKGSRTVHIRDTLSTLPVRISTSSTLVTVYCLFVPDWEDYASDVTAYAAGIGADRSDAVCSQSCAFDLPGMDEDEQISVRQALIDAIDGHKDGNSALTSFSIGSRALYRSDFFSAYGSLFFLGIILSIVFIAAAALIIYYKQLSEGYEDQRRFDIMQKVGMTKDEIRRTVNSQVLTVFFAPLLMAGLHLAFAFPFVQKLVRLWGVMNTPLLIATSVICYLAFALFYVFVYRGTARAYYSIVSGGDAR
ncbi:MAG: ABC transporter permease [Oscillospiraceae bacterium]|nr:ABC transporter permease [Oscillospiraceae bacterium]